MKITEFIKREAINWILILLPFVYIYLVYDKLPRFEPFQFNSSQRIYYAVLFVMGISVFWYLIFLIKPSIVPRTTFHDHLRNFHKIKTLILGFASLLSLTFISQKIGIAFNWSKIGFILGMVFMAAYGNLYPTIRYNFFTGIRNPWTQSNELIWKKTHRFAGKVFFWGGLIGALYGILFKVYPVPYMPVIYVGYIFALVFVPKVYSYLIYRQLQSQHQN
ncbi:MAG: SdpI family protein [Mangrovibacterium sp.]